MPQNPDARPPADDSELLERIRVFIADAADKPMDEVGPDVDVYETLGVDSLGATCIFIDISYEFGIPEPQDETNFLELRA